MVEIRCIKDIREKINIDEIEYKLLIDVIQMTALFEVEFGERARSIKDKFSCCR